MPPSPALTAEPPPRRDRQRGGPPHGASVPRHRHASATRSGADFIVIGQVQLRDGDVLVRTHLIRGGDQAHLWIDEFPRGGASDAEFQARVATGVRRALVTYAP